ncbi:hypothetical protein [Polyangium sp. y55x31]|uniref:hypothetical protein n=1 Tax=Polyangium sp. y55x31 TaxID=3042688 RepID=UPI002483193C|nr:hypothetical protein [Polyangium sp. y55x31]MDI1483834.1 hypothetical protein [Polyangium sp. y55x31]
MTRAWKLGAASLGIWMGLSGAAQAQNGAGSGAGQTGGAGQVQDDIDNQGTQRGQQPGTRTPNVCPPGVDQSTGEGLACPPEGLPGTPSGPGATPPQTDTQPPSTATQPPRPKTQPPRSKTQPPSTKTQPPAR